MPHRHTSELICRALMAVLVVVGLVCRGLPAEDEVQFPASEFKLLDTFEAQALAKADKTFGAKDYRGAVAAYESFILEYGKSRAVPYALLRKARALDLDNKRNEACRMYREVLDYFRNDVAYAAPAIYYLAQTHWNKGDTDKAIQVWDEMAADAGYRKHPLGGIVLNRLAQEYEKKGKWELAMNYYELVAVDFRATNPGAAVQAINRIVAYWMRALNEPRLRAFYEQVKTFENQPAKVGADKASDRDYWETVRGLVRQYGRFEDGQADARTKYHKYWAGVLQGKYLDDDAFQLEWINTARLGDHDEQKWIERLDAQFERNFKPGDWGRIIQWMNLFSSNKAKVQAYYAKLDFTKMNNGLIETVMRFFCGTMRDMEMGRTAYSKLNFAQMNNGQIENIMRFFYESLRDNEMGRATYQKLKRDQYDDKERQRLAKYFFTKDASIVKELIGSLKDRDFAKWVTLEYFIAEKEEEKALALAEELCKLAAYAKDALKLKATLHEQLKQYDKAIGAYRQLDEPPATLFAIASCYEHWGRIDDCVQQLTEIENFFKDKGSSTAWRIATVLHRAGRQKPYVAQLRYIMKRYPKSKESNSAHLELERLGFKIGGGVDDDK